MTNSAFRVFFTSVTINKILLTIGSIVVLAVLCQAMPSWREDRTFYMLFLVATAVNSMMPDYLYRGLEQMETITIRAVVIKAFFTVMIVLLLKKPEQYCLIPDSKYHRLRCYAAVCLCASVA